VDSVELSAKIGAMIVGAAVRGGADRGELLARTGFDPSLASDPDTKISLELESALWNEGARLTGDDAFGLHAAEHVEPGAFDVLDYAVRTAPTLRAALERLARYNRLLHDAAVFTLTDRPPVVRLEHSFKRQQGRQSRHAAEFTLASIVVVGAALVGQPLEPTRVEFAHAPPSAAVLDEHRRIFARPPSFAQPVNALELDTALLARPIPHADPALSRVLERHAEALLAALPPERETTTERVRQLLSKTLGDAAPSLADTAARLKLGERSLQRKLADEGCSFESLLDEVRQSLALRYLADRSLAIAEVAYLLGYSEPSPFHRAFKRWTGKTPSEARGRAA
jgi:AraC-like DNA-binding protein